MIKETNLVDLSKVILDNPFTWNERIKYEIPRQWGINKIKSKTKITKTKEEKIRHIKEYQHNYYMQITKIKRKQKRGEKDAK